MPWQVATLDEEQAQYIALSI